MNDTLTLRDIDDYVEALLAFLPTQSQIQMIEDYSSIIENNLQYQRIVRRKLRIARSHNVFDNVNIEELQSESKSKFISIMDIIERTLEDYKIHVKNQLETTFTISRKVSFALTRGDSVDEKHVTVGYDPERLTFILTVDSKMAELYEFVLIIDGKEVKPSHIDYESDTYISFENIEQDQKFEIEIRNKKIIQQDNG